MYKSSYKTVIRHLRFQNLVFVVLHIGSKIKKLWNGLGFSRELVVWTKQSKE